MPLSVECHCEANTPHKTKKKKKALYSEEEMNISKWKISVVRSQKIRNTDIGEEKQMPMESKTTTS